MSVSFKEKYDMAGLRRAMAGMDPDHRYRLTMMMMKERKVPRETKDSIAVYRAAHPEDFPNYKRKSELYRSRRLNDAVVLGSNVTIYGKNGQEFTGIINHPRGYNRSAKRMNYDQGSSGYQNSYNGPGFYVRKDSSESSGRKGKRN